MSPNASAARIRTGVCRNEMFVPEKFHKPERDEYNAFPGNAISFISRPARRSSYFVDRDLPLPLPFSLVLSREAEVESDTYQLDGASD